MVRITSFYVEKNVKLISIDFFTFFLKSVFLANFLKNRSLLQKIIILDFGIKIFLFLCVIIASCERSFSKLILVISDPS